MLKKAKMGPPTPGRASFLSRGKDRMGGKSFRSVVGFAVHGEAVKNRGNSF